MKKVLALLTALLLMVPAALAAPVSPVNPEGYDRLLVLDIFSNDDAELDENGDFPEVVTPEVTVQGCFGSIDLSQGEDAPQFQGFDESGDGVYALGLAENCEILMPTDMMDPVENAPCEDLVAWFLKVREERDDFTFYASFELDENGDLTKLEYEYHPFD